MRLFAAIVFGILFSVFANAQENSTLVPIIEFEAQAFNSSDGKVGKVYVETGFTDSDGEAQQLANYFQKQFIEYKQKNVRVDFAGVVTSQLGSDAEKWLLQTTNQIVGEFSQASIEKSSRNVAQDKKRIVELVDLSKEKANNWSKEFTAWFQQEKHYKYTFTSIRFLLNSSVTTASFITQAHMPVATSAFIGIFAGTLSASTQFLNAPLQRWFENSHLLEKVFGLTGEKARRTAQEIEKFSKFWFLESTFLGLIKSSMFAMGALQNVSFVALTGSIMWTASKSLFGQATWDIANAKQTVSAIEANPQIRNKIQFRSDLLSLGISAASVAFATTDMCGLKFGNVGLKLLGVGGALFYGKILFQNYLPKIKRSICDQKWLPFNLSK